LTFRDRFDILLKKRLSPDLSGQLSKDIKCYMEARPECGYIWKTYKQKLGEEEMSDTPFTLFYAWQSDTPTRSGRNFVENAASKALKGVHASGVLDLAPRLDKDTKGVPGMPDIANTILDKIRASSAILADLTFVGKDALHPESKEKLLPNPNVLLELGYAIAHLGWESVICVMNTHYGDNKDLPFDLRHRRWPLSFDLPPDADPETRKAIKQQLIKDIEEAIHGIAELPPSRTAADVDSRLSALESLVSSISGSLGQISEMRSAVDRIQRAIVQEEEDSQSPENRVKAALAELMERVESQAFEGITYCQGMLGIVVLPCTPPDDPLPLSQKEKEITLKLTPLYSSGWDHRRHGTSIVTLSEWDDRVDAVSEITEDGLIRAAGHEVISVNRQYFPNVNVPDETHVIPSVAFEKSIIEAIHKYIRLFMEFEVAGPWIVAMSLFNLKTSVLFVGPRFSFDGRPFTGEAITPPPVLVPEDTNISNPQSVAHVLRPAFDFIWREHNFPKSLNYGVGGNWTGT